jgi:hypothetical protein
MGTEPSRAKASATRRVSAVLWPTDARKLERMVTSEARTGVLMRHTLVTEVVADGTFPSGAQVGRRPLPS